MEKEFLDKANELQSRIYFWEDRVQAFRHVVACSNLFDVEFNDDGRKVWLETSMSEELMLPFAKQCLDYAEKKLAEAKQKFAEL